MIIRISAEGEGGGGLSVPVMMMMSPGHIQDSGRKATLSAYDSKRRRQPSSPDYSNLSLPAGYVVSPPVSLDRSLNL
jgi:hypothetical protein